jgi:hypothetical protein
MTTIHDYSQLGATRIAYRNGGTSDILYLRGGGKTLFARIVGSAPRGSQPGAQIDSTFVWVTHRNWVLYPGLVGGCVGASLVITLPFLFFAEKPFATENHMIGYFSTLGAGWGTFIITYPFMDRKVLVKPVVNGAHDASYIQWSGASTTGSINGAKQ